MTDIRMPKIATVRKYIPNNLSDDKIEEIMEWLIEYTGNRFIKPNNLLLKVLITWEDAGKSTKEILADKELTEQIEVASKEKGKSIKEILEEE